MPMHALVIKSASVPALGVRYSGAHQSSVGMLTTRDPLKDVLTTAGRHCQCESLQHDIQLRC